MHNIIAVDVGSTSARAAVFTAGGQRLARADHPFAINHPAPHHAEHNSEEIWHAVCTAVRAAVTQSKIPPAQIAGLAFDATCSLVLLDRNGHQLTASTTGEHRWNTIMWADHRAVAEAEEITATGHRILDHIGGTMSPEMELPKLLWLRRHLPKTWQSLGQALDLADFLTWRATGKTAVSACTVTCKWGYLNHEPTPWPTDLFTQLGLQDLPGLPTKALPIGHPAGPLTPQAARDLGLPETCIVGVGLIDAHAGGLGLLAPLTSETLNNHLAIIAGTSSCHMAASPDARRIPGVWGPYYGAMLPNMWLTEAGQSATGALLDHILDWHAEGRALGADRHARIATRIEHLLATEGPNFAAPLRVLPDFNGNRSPLADPRATGAIHGLTLDSSFDSLAKLYYAACVAIALGTRHIIDALNASGYAIDTIHLTGGHTANLVLLRLYADATNCPVHLPAEPDSVLLGTAAVAATATALYPDLATAAAAMASPARILAPNPATAAHFAAEYRRFRLMHTQRQALEA